MYTGEFGEVQEFAECSECNAPLALSDVDAFQINGDHLLCVRCATRRGGLYDAEEHRWIMSPQVDDLLTEHYPE